MKPKGKFPKRNMGLALVCAALIWLTTGSQDVAQEKSAKAAVSTDKTAPMGKGGWPTDPALYVGEETCKTCHAEVYTQFATTPHIGTTMEGKLEANEGRRSGMDAKRATGREKRMWTAEGIRARFSRIRMRRRNRPASVPGVPCESGRTE